jgi:uncharacterized membrane protein
MKHIINILTHDLVFLAIGVLVIIFRKQFTAFVMRYHQRRLQHMKRTESKLQRYPEKSQMKAWSTANRFTEIMLIIIGAGFVIMSMLSLLGILEHRQ